MATGGTYFRIRRLSHPDEKGSEFPEEYAVAPREEGLSERERWLWCTRDALIERQRTGCGAHTLKNQEWKGAGCGAKTRMAVFRGTVCCCAQTGDVLWREDGRGSHAEEE